MRLGRYAEAAPVLERTLRVFRMLGARHPNVALVLADRGLLETAEHRAAEGLADCGEAEAITEAALGKDGVRVEVALNCLAGALLALGRSADALPVAERALAIGEKQKADPMDLADTEFVLSRAAGQRKGARPRPEARR